MVQMDDENDRILWCGNLHEKVTEEILYELFLQAGPLERVKLVSGSGPRYAFITFQHRVSVPYTIDLMNGIRLFDRPLRLQTRTGSGSGTSSTPGPSSAPGTPVNCAPLGFPAAPSGPPMPFLRPMQQPQISQVPLAAQLNAQHVLGMAFGQHMQQQQQQPPWLRNDAGASTPGGFLAQMHAPFHRSSSEPESLGGAIRNGRRMGPGSGVHTESWDRSPYSRPTPPGDRGDASSSSRQQEFLHPSAMLLAQNVGTQLRAMRQHQMPHGAGSHWENRGSFERHHSQQNGGGGSHRYH